MTKTIYDMFTTSEGPYTVSYKCYRCPAAYDRQVGTMYDEYICANCALIEFRKVTTKARREAWVAFVAANGVEEAKVMILAYDTEFTLPMAPGRV